MAKQGTQMRERPAALTAADLERVMPFIDGRGVESETMHHLTRHNPSTGDALPTIPAGCVTDVDAAVRCARKTFTAGLWQSTSPAHRKAVLHRWADLIQAKAATFDALDALEMGKPLSTPAFSAHSAAGFVRFNAELPDKCSGDVLPSDASSTVIQTRMARGVVAAIVPWNFPTYNCVLKAAPALAAGNSVVLKPSELASQAALLLARLALDAGLPAGVFNVIPGRGEIVGKALAEHMDVDMVTFTGSTAVGKQVMASAGRSNMKAVSAECGGKSPHIVLDDGLDIDAIADAVAAMILLNQGQVCSTGSRVLVQDTLEEALIEKVVARMKDIKIGDAQDPSTTFGPLASRAQLDKAISYIAEAPAEGARLVYGGARMLRETGGFFAQPAVFANVDAYSRVAQEEIFGPVLCVMRFADLEEAIRLANSTWYGLAAYAWTTRAATAFKLGTSLRTALTLVNTAIVASEGPGHAFSGEPAGLSGIGEECGIAGFESYRRRQTVWFNHG